MSYIVVVNGLDHAFLREFGCDCGRCMWARRAANTSVSVIGLSERCKVETHYLFDIGWGVVDSLVYSALLDGEKAKLDALLFSHWHPDHVLDLNRLCESWKRTVNRRGGTFGRIPAWSRKGTLGVLSRLHDYELEMLEMTCSEEAFPPGRLLQPVPFARHGVVITPFTVSHCTADFAGPCCAGFVLETVDKKCVLLWDMDNTNRWIVEPSNDDERKCVEKLSCADYVFVDCNTWKAEAVNGKNTGHTSFTTAMEYVKALRPKETSETVLMHLSGHEDGPGNPGWGWCDLTWQLEAGSLWCRNRMPGKVRVPRIGDQFIL